MRMPDNYSNNFRCDGLVEIQGYSKTCDSCWKGCSFPGLDPSVRCEASWSQIGSQSSSAAAAFVSLPIPAIAAQASSRSLWPYREV